MYKLLFFLLIFSNFSYAQRQCYTDEYNNILKENNSEFNLKQQQLEEHTTNYINLLPLMNTNNTVINIPVVIHILYNDSIENISNEQIQSQLDSLNKDFRALNADISNVPAVFSPLTADIGIEFCLATQDPDGNISTGINRVYTENTSFSVNNNMKFTSEGGIDVWDSERYLNIWVCDLSGNTLGFAQFPGGPESTDGVVVDYEYFGSIGTALSPYDLGRTLTHEVGHWLNLRHIWGDSYCGDDLVDDTPTQESANGGCQTFPSVSCNNGSHGDMFMNYMDYSYDNCLHMFTTGQKNRMIAALNSNRSGLLNSNLCDPFLAGCTDSLANNFNPLANSNDSSCQYSCVDYSISILTDCWGEETSWELIKNGDIIQSSPTNSYENNTLYEYNLCLTQGCYTFSINDSYGDGLSGGSYSSCNSDGDFYILNNNNPIVSMSQANFGSNISFEFCVELVSGCTDSVATNFDINAQLDDGSCEYYEPNACDIIVDGLYVDNIIHNRARFNWQQPNILPSHYMIRYRELGSFSWTVITAGSINTTPFTGTSRNRYFLEPNTTYEWSIRSRLLNANGSIDCQSLWSENSQFTTLESCPNLIDLSVETEANWVTFVAQAPSNEWGVWQSKAKINEIGTNSYRYVIGDNDGNINTIKGNFTADTDYQWHTKAWCTGNVDENGNSDLQYHSSWGEFSTFSTQSSCDKLPINLNTSSNLLQTNITMNWDSPVSGNPDHYFIELKNLSTNQIWQWNNIPGNANSKTKYNLDNGPYIWKIRAACGTNGTTWATPFSDIVFYNLGASRISKSFHFEIYPNPSKGLFYLDFISDDSIEIKVFNSMGKNIKTITALNKTVIDLSNYAKGIYNVLIKSDDKIFNKQIVLQ
jgi:hypothetical protein